MTIVPEPEGERESFLVTLARLEAKLDVALGQHAARLDRLDEKLNRLDDHETRLRRLETAEHPLTGKNLMAYTVAALTILLGVVAIMEKILK